MLLPSLQPIAPAIYFGGPPRRWGPIFEITKSFFSQEGLVNTPSSPWTSAQLSTSIHFLQLLRQTLLGTKNANAYGSGVINIFSPPSPLVALVFTLGVHFCPLKTGQPSRRLKLFDDFRGTTFEYEPSTFSRIKLEGWRKECFT